jgi:hypothetical protein
MIRILCVTGLLTTLAGSSHAQADKRDTLEKNIDRALVFLKNNQEKKNGAWYSNDTPHTAVTALAVMAFLSAGHVPDEGPYGAVVTKGIRYILSKQRADGIFDCPTGTTMYHQGICTLMLAEVAGMTDAKLGKECRTALQKAVKVLLAAQAKSGTAKGGWRYAPDGNDADMSVTGWQLLALRAAKNLGCDIPSERIDLALEYVRRCHDSNSGGFGYQPGNSATIPCTGTGILCLAICGDQKLRESREILQAGSYLINAPIDPNATYFSYGIYYGAQAAFQLGSGKARNNYWEVYRPKLHKVLFASQLDGSWPSSDGIGASYSTAMAVLALTVEYRFLPIYQRHEQSELKDKASGRK